MAKSELFPTFVNQAGYFGTDHPMQAVLTPETQFVFDLYRCRRAFYAGYHDAEVQTMARFQFELEPGYADSLDSAVEDATLHKDWNRITFQIIQFPYACPRPTQEVSPILLQPYKGSWHAGADIYKEWRKTWFTRAGFAGVGERCALLAADPDQLIGGSSALSLQATGRVRERLCQARR